MSNLTELAGKAKQASYELAKASAAKKNNALAKICELLKQSTDEIMAANEIDLKNAREKGISDAMLDRLSLSHERICAIADGVSKVCMLDDPIGEVMETKRRPNGLIIGKKRVPLGLIGIIYEARPNVTVDAAVLCLKSSNAVILRGGSEAIHSNTALVNIMRRALREQEMNENCICLVEDTSRETATAMMRLNGYIDVLIPRGGKGLIRSVIENATVPVIETGTGNCHVYVHEQADFDMAESILVNAKVSRPAVCNAAESLVIDKKIAPEFLPRAYKALMANGVEVRGCEECIKLCPDMKRASEEDFYTEYNDYIMSVKLVDGLDEAIEHINTHNTKHSEAIITDSYEASQRFLDEIDAAAVYVNASTRFTDGFEFGFGAEIGISTQKMHARGPMGLKELTSVKYIVYGNGQIRQ